MNIVIFGAGTTGTFLADAFSKEQHNVILIDPNPHDLLLLAQNSEVATICSSGLDWRVLEEAKEGEDSFFLAMTRSDGDNLTACTLAKKLGYKKTIARVSEISFLDQSKFNFREVCHVDHMLAPEIIISHDLLKSIMNPKTLAIENFHHGKLQMQTYKIPKGWKYAGSEISTLDFRSKYLVGLIKRAPKKSHKVLDDDDLIYPRGDNKIEEEDEVTFLGKTEDMAELPNLLGLNIPSVNSVVIAGASSYARHLGHILNDKNISVKIIEEDEKLCESLADELTFATVLNHDETDLEFLIEENVEKADAFVSCTMSTEKNLLISTLAQEIGCEQVITLISDKTYSHLLDRLGISFALSEKLSIANLVFSSIYGEVVVSVTSMYRNQVKVIELEMSEGSPIAGMKISDLAKKLPKKCLLGFIYSKGDVKLAKGNEAIHPGDCIVTFIAPDNVDQLRSLL